MASVQLVSEEGNAQHSLALAARNVQGVASTVKDTQELSWSL